MYTNIYLQATQSEILHDIPKEKHSSCLVLNSLHSSRRKGNFDKLLQNQHLPCIRPQLRVCSTPQGNTPRWVPWTWEGLNMHQKTEGLIQCQKTQKACNERCPVEDAAREAKDCWVQKDKTEPRVEKLMSQICWVHQCNAWAFWVLTRSQWRSMFGEREVKWAAQDKALGLTVTRAFRHLVWKQPELQRELQSVADSV